MNSHSKMEWMIGELLGTPRKLFVLWVVKAGLCSTLDDFRRHYGPDFQSAALVDALEKEGFLDQRSGEVVLTEAGQQALAYFQSPQPPRPHRGKVLLADHNQERVVEIKRLLSRRSEFDVKTISSFQKLRSYLESPLSENDSSLIFVAADLLLNESLPAIKGKTRNILHPSQLSELLNRNAGTKFCLIPSSHSMVHLLSDHPNLFYSAELARRFGYLSSFDLVKSKALHFAPEA